MTKYIALLRGINVGGNNKVSMPDLKTAFERQGFTSVSTYINSGNVIFESGLSEAEIKTACEKLIEAAFGLKITVCVISAAELIAALENAPEWWNKGDAKHNAIFVIPPLTCDKAVADMGEVKPEYEKIAYQGRAIFWTAPLKTFSHTRWSQVVKNKAVYNAITIRNANTTIKIGELVKN